jgi:hypothetical protein
MKPPGKEGVTIRSALAVVSAHPPAEEHDVLRTGLRVGPAVSERLCSRQPWRSAQQWEDVPLPGTIPAAVVHVPDPIESAHLHATRRLATKSYARKTIIRRRLLKT